MRRLAKQDRKDDYRSRRDYQQVKEALGSRVSARKGRIDQLRLVVQSDGGDLQVIGAGAYLRPSRATLCTLHMASDDGTEVSRSHNLPRDWTRLGVATRTETLSRWKATLTFEPAVEWVDIWGFTLGPARFDESAGERIKKFLDQVNAVHLVPETLYHDYSDAADSARQVMGAKNFAFDRDVATLSVKKCCYCQRALPIDLKRPAALAFHKHSKKVTGHQNECRACKKWRINDTFNPLRTVDQLHESSVITRERKQFLREPAILARIKDREGDGLKSIIWKQFKKRCFQCGKGLKLGQVQLDHTRPLAYLWPIDRHATCLCGDCNNHKGDRFPVDVYSEQKLRELSKIVGLSLAELKSRKLCEIELQRIVSDIVHFTEKWDPRTFNSTARKVKEIKPDVDLFEILRAASAATHKKLRAALRGRPDPVI
jgi:hypothetical protein